MPILLKLICLIDPDMVGSSVSIDWVMNYQETSHRHDVRLNRSMNYAHQFYADVVSLDQMASVACLSKYHFARLFGDYVGESPIAFASRIKLERAAYLLAFCRDWSVSEIAAACSFSSGQTFARGFKHRFGATPSTFRQEHVFHLGQRAGREQLMKALLALGEHPDTFDSGNIGYSRIRLVRRPAIRVAYIRNLGPYGSGGDIPRAEQAIKDWALAHDFWQPEKSVIGVSWDNAHLTPENACRYDACIPLPHHQEVPEDVSVQTIPGGFYATIRANPEVEEIPLIWESFLLLLKDWPRFKSLGLRVSQPYFEIYSGSDAPGNSTLDLYAPVALKYGRL